MNHILVIGESGQLATALGRVTVTDGIATEFLGRRRLDLSRPETVFNVVTDIAPHAVINAAAYTAVDRAEEEAEIAHAINAQSPGEVARACAALDIPFVHISTDYVFDGEKVGSYVESDPVAPLNAYGASKALGEAHVLDAGARASILRTSWVYSATGSNFVRTMLRIARNNETVRVVADQRGRPTWAHDLASDCLAVTRLLLDRDHRAEGVLHAAGGGEPCSWADFAEAVFTCAHAACVPAARVERIPAAAFATGARRPANSVLSLDRIETILGPRPDWRESVGRACAEIFAQSSAR